MLATFSFVVNIPNTVTTPDASAPEAIAKQIPSETLPIKQLQGLKSAQVLNLKS